MKIEITKNGLIAALVVILILGLIANNIILMLKMNDIYAQVMDNRKEISDLQKGVSFQSEKIVEKIDYLNMRLKDIRNELEEDIRKLR